MRNAECGVRNLGIHSALRRAPGTGRHSALLLVAVPITVFGCTQRSTAPKRAKVEGKVTLNGQPVANGLIRFMALDPNGLNVVANVKDGQFTVPENEGPTKGKYRVEFS